jgi:hypothetical protein
MSLTDEQTDKALNAINAYRARHNAEPLVYNERLCVMAQKHAVRLAETDMVYHSPEHCEDDGKLPGENLAMVYGFKVPAEYACKLWYDGIEKYDFAKNELQPASGYFSQVILKKIKNCFVRRIFFSHNCIIFYISY